MIIAGSGDIQTANDLITSLQLNEFVSIRQWLDPEKRDELLRESDVFLLPSYNEGLPMSMLEAMAFGLPVIVTPVGGIPEIVSQGREGLFVQPGRIDEIAHTMEFLILNKQERGDMGIRASLRVEPLRIEKYVDSLISLYKKAVFAG
jgi:glycosyltransferase involved in cell wall biosynthesis